MELFVFYTSKNNIERACTQLLGPQKELQSTRSNQKGRSVTLGASLSNLLKLVGSLSLNGNYISQDTASELTKYTSDWNDRLIELIRMFDADDHLSDISEIEKYPDDLLFKFDLPLKLHETYATTELGSLIHVRYDSPCLEFESMTSRENWASRSLINNVLFVAQRHGDFKLKGVCMPLRKEMIAGKLILVVQILLLYSSEGNLFGSRLTVN